MTLNQEYWDPADILLFEVASPDGFLSRFKNREFDEEHWQRLWTAVARLLNHNLGQLDPWASHDLAELIETIHRTGYQLVGRNVDSLDEYERSVLSAIEFVNSALGQAED